MTEEKVVVKVKFRAKFPNTIIYYHMTEEKVVVKVKCCPPFDKLHVIQEM